MPLTNAAPFAGYLRLRFMLSKNRVSDALLNQKIGPLLLPNRLPALHCRLYTVPVLCHPSKGESMSSIAALQG